MNWIHLANRHRLAVVNGLLGILIVAGLAGVLVTRTHSSASSPGSTPLSRITQLEQESGIDTGVPLHGKPAPDFTLTDQFGHKVSFSQFRGKVVILAFTDSECTTICPLTSQSLVEMLRMLPASAAEHVQLLGINANPQANSIADIKSYSIAHGLENKWLFLTGSAVQLSRVWKAYGIYVQIVQGAIDHTPAVYVIDSQGREQKAFLTSAQYGVVGGEAFALADTVAPLLPGHVNPPTQFPVERQLSTTQPVTLPRITPSGLSGTVILGPGKAELVYFFASWAPHLQNQLEALNAVAQTQGSLRVVAVDIGSTESSSTAVQVLLRSLKTPLDYPLAYDALGDVADAYKVQDVPWLTLTSSSGIIVGSLDGWGSTAMIQQWIRQGLHTGQ